MSRRYRAPSEDGGVLEVPPRGEWAELAGRNRQHLDGGGCRVFGFTAGAFRATAAAEIARHARKYLWDRGEPLPDRTADRVVLAGHQPELFHPGVWVKNFALNRLARETGALPVNLVVDNDTAKSAGVRVPVLDGGEAAHFEQVPFDTHTGEVPYEERRVADEAAFAAFPAEVREWGRRWGFEPLAARNWPAADRSAPLGERFAAARRSAERRWGCHNLELPVSHLQRLTSFSHFVAGVLADLPRFHAVYNQAVREYRRREGVRSRNHPVPDLAAEGDWLEAPFWLWRSGDARRGRLMARRAGRSVEVRTGAGTTAFVADDLGERSSLLSELEEAGVKLRPRALTLTLFARLCVADLFVHGIGGGKYDELTDDIIRAYFGIEPPAYAVLSATLRLPLPAFPATAEELRRVERELRDREWNPQRYAGGDAALVRERAEWVGRTPATHDGRRERYFKLRELNDRLRGSARPAAELGERRERLKRELAANEVLRRRDYSFVLFPEEALREFCAGFLGEGVR